MTCLRAAAALALAFALAACANGAPQAAATQVAASPGTTATAPAQATTVTQPRTNRVPPPLGKPLPPVRYEHACKVDGDCADLERCKAAANCRCVEATCIAPRPAVDPVVDPAPSPPPET